MEYIDWRKVEEIADGDSILMNDILYTLLADIRVIDHLFDMPSKQKKKIMETRISQVTKDVITCTFFEYFFEKKTPIGSPDMNHEINEKIFVEICQRLSSEIKRMLKDVNS